MSEAIHEYCSIKKVLFQQNTFLSSLQLFLNYYYFSSGYVIVPPWQPVDYLESQGQVFCIETLLSVCVYVCVWVCVPALIPLNKVPREGTHFFRAGFSES